MAFLRILNLSVNLGQIFDSRFVDKISQFRMRHIAIPTVNFALFVNVPENRCKMGQNNFDFNMCERSAFQHSVKKSTARRQFHRVIFSRRPQLAILVGKRHKFGQRTRNVARASKCGFCRDRQTHSHAAVCGPDSPDGVDRHLMLQARVIRLDDDVVELITACRARMNRQDELVVPDCA